MELIPSHREALIGKLEEREKDLSIAKSCLEKHKERDIAPHFEIDIFLIQCEIKLIKKSLIENQIDY